MVHKFQELEDYDTYDPVPYQGGYDQAATYGSLKPADKECAYPRSQYAVGVEEPDAQYGNERNPYEGGYPGPSVYRGSPKPGAVYGGGRDRTQPSHDEAEPDKGVPTANGHRKSASGRQEEPSKPSYSQEEQSDYPKPRQTYEVSEESGYRKLTSIYDEEQQSGYGKAAYSFGEGGSAYRQPYYGYGFEAGSGYLKPPFSDVDQYGYRNPFYGYGEEESGYHQPQSAHTNEDESAFRKLYNYGEEEESDIRKPQPTSGEEKTAYDRSAPYNYEGAYSGYGYGVRPNYYGEEASAGSDYGNGYGYGGYGGYWKKFADDDPARFGGGSVFIEEPIQKAPPPAPAYGSWW